MLAPAIQPVTASMKNTSRKPAETGVTSCHDKPPSTVLKTSPPPDKIEAPTAKGRKRVDGLQPIESKIEDLKLFFPRFFPPSIERERTPRLPPKNPSFPPAQPVELSAKPTAMI